MIHRARNVWWRTTLNTRFKSVLRKTENLSPVYLVPHRYPPINFVFNASRGYFPFCHCFKVVYNDWNNINDTTRNKKNNNKETAHVIGGWMPCQRAVFFHSLSFNFCVNGITDTYLFRSLTALLSRQKGVKACDILFKRSLCEVWFLLLALQRKVSYLQVFS